MISRFSSSGRLGLLVVLSILLVGCTEPKEDVSEKMIEPKTLQEASTEVKTLSEQEIAILKSEIKAAFAGEKGIELSLLSEPFLYDLDNDGVEEVIISSAGSDLIEGSIFYLSAYDLNGDEVSTLSKDIESRQTIHRIQNETYGNSIAIISYGLDTYSANIVTLKSGKMKLIDTVETTGFIEQLGDVNEDEYEDFAGIEYDVGIGSDRVPKVAGLAEKIWFVWDTTKKEYLPQVSDVVGTDAIELLDEELALRIMRSARQTQLSWVENLSQDEVEVKLSPFFSTNFIYEYIQSDHTFHDEETGTYSPMFLYKEDLGGVLPDIGNDSLNLSSSEDGNIVIVTKDLDKSSNRGEPFTTFEMTFVKTSKGWRIDRVDYK